MRRSRSRSRGSTAAAKAAVDKSKEVPQKPSLSIFAALGAAPKASSSQKLQWHWDGSLLYAECLLEAAPKESKKVAAFDFDGCLVKTSLYQKGPDAWSILFPGLVEEKLAELHSMNYRLVIMSNQAAIGKATKTKEKTIAEKVGRFEGFVRKVGLPFLILVATADTKVADKFRKPAPGMWNSASGRLGADAAESFFVGDAAGRPGDHSDSDLGFAKNAGLRFFTEDTFFKAVDLQGMLMS